jgi:predicted small secreted protein
MNVKKALMAFTLLALMAGMFSLTGCNTWHGAGKDVERTSERMQHGDQD